MDNWDLQAIVRGCSRDFSEALMADDDYNNTQQSSCFAPPVGSEYGSSHCFDGNATRVFDELDELYKLFSPHSLELDNNIHTCVPPKQITPIKTTTANAVVSTIVPKRRKNMGKRVVNQVTVDDLSLDIWAWRKYGQKPIKGSPYPRSYYRCSTSKGCSAKKQVERSNLNPAMFIVTYTDEHNHSHPIRRSTLAGKSKQKLSKLTSTAMSSKYYETSTPPTIVFSSPVVNESSSCSPISSTSAFSPSSPLMVSCVEDQFWQRDRKQIIMDSEEQTVDDYCLSFNDASALEDWFSDQAPMTYQW